MTEAIYRANVLVCGGTGCEASGSTNTYRALVAEVERRGLANEVEVIHTGCRGFCAMGPVMIIYPDGIFYCQVKEEDIPFLVEETLLKGRVVERLTYKEPSGHQAVPLYGEIPFYSKQLRITLRNCGMIDPENIEEYIARDGYQALTKVLSSMTPQQVYEGSNAQSCAGAEVPALPPVSSGNSRRGPKATSSTSSVMPTKGTPARSWIAPSSKVIPMV